MEEERKMGKKNSIVSFINGFCVSTTIFCVTLAGMKLTGTGLFAYQKEAQGVEETVLEEQDSDFTDVIDKKLLALNAYIDKFFLSDLNEEGIDADKLKEGVYKGYISGLGDIYSEYYTKEEYEDLMESSSGEYDGIGVSITEDESTGCGKIISVNKGSPAESAGMKEDDLIYEVDGEKVVGLDLDTVVSKIRGKEGTKVNITVYRTSENDYVNMDIVRKTIEVITVDYKMLENDIAHVVIARFDANTDELFSEAISKAKAEGAKGFIFDVRSNPGGNYETVCNMLDEILPEGVLVYTMDKNGEKVEEKSDAACLDMPMTVLINGNSASAAEIFAGAIKDFKAGKIIGTTSFGKGIVQGIYGLPDGSAIKLTISRYYTPSGVKIHGTGIEPDIEIDLDTDAKEDVQLNKAIEELKKDM